jgi:hypothetical protein
MNGSSRAHEFYKQITEHANPPDFLANLIGKEETEFLEFKGASLLSDKAIKEIWSQILSAFANTEGGVVIWGIRAGRHADPTIKPNVAASLNLSPDPEKLLQTLNDVVLAAVNPPVAGVTCACYKMPGAREGFVVCLIPESKHKPHRAELDNWHQYFQRIQDNSVVIPHSLLRSLFYPHTRPDLRLEVTLRDFDPTGTSQVGINLHATLHNDGAASATDMVVVVASSCDLRHLDIGGNWELRSPKGNPFRASSHVALHPGDKTLLFEGQHGVPVTKQDGTDRLAPNYPIKFDVTFYMRDHESQRVIVTFGDDDFKPNASKCGIRFED